MAGGEDVVVAVDDMMIGGGSGDARCDRFDPILHGRWEQDHRVKTIVQEFKGMHEAPSEQELHKAKEYSKGRLLLRMEDTRAVASWLGAQELLQNHVRTADEVVDLLDAVNSSEVARVSNEYLDDNKFRLAVVGPRGGAKALTGLLRY